MSNHAKKIINRIRRHARVRAKIEGSKERPRLSVFRSSKHVFLQIIDDEAGKTLASFNDKSVGKKKLTKTERAYEAGKELAGVALKAGVRKVIFDKGGYKYHGRVRAVADGARAGGLVF